MRLPALLLISGIALASDLQHSRFYDRESLIVANDLLELTVLPLGGSFARIVMKSDPGKTNPMWDSLRQDREEGVPLRRNGEVGHFVCVDGFGPPSTEEYEAGMREHGEANTLVWKQESFRVDGNASVLVQSVRLPKVQEVLTRTLRMVDGEPIVQVHSKLESQLAFDHPVMWTEHACIGSPFLQPGATVVDLSKNRAMTRPWKSTNQPANPPHRLAAGKVFEWPMAPLQAGGTIDLRGLPNAPDSMDQTGQLMTPAGEYAFVTALNLKKRLMLGYVFRPAEYPWLQNWESYRPEGTISRGLEFGTVVFGRPRREAITEGRLFGELLYRWLPAKSSIETTYLMFWTPVPEGFRGVDEITVEAGRLRVVDRHSGRELVLKSSARF